jgi:transcriptional regulator with XRE-family HTH domain
MRRAGLIEEETTGGPTLGEFCRELRKRAGLNQVSLSESLAHVQGFTQAAISRLENDQWLPDAGQMEQLLRALRVTETEARTARCLAAALAVRDG